MACPSRPVAAPPTSMPMSSVRCLFRAVFSQVDSCLLEKLVKEKIGWKCFFRWKDPGVYWISCVFPVKGELHGIMIAAK